MWSYTNIIVKNVAVYNAF